MLDPGWVTLSGEVLSLISLGVGMWIAKSFFPLVGRFLPAEDRPPVWPVRIGLTLLAFAVAYLIAAPLRAAVSAVVSLVALRFSGPQPASANTFVTAWGTGTFASELMVSIGTLILAFGVLFWVGQSIHERLRAHPVLSDLTNLQYWALVLAAASLVWRAAQGIWLEILLIRPPSLMATASSRGMIGFLAGLGFGLLMTFLVIAYFYNFVAAEYEQREAAPGGTGR